MISLTLLVILLWLGTFTRDNEIANVVAFVGLGLLVGAAGPKTTDYATYETYYHQVGTGTAYFERGYTALEQLFSNWGFSYADFRLALALLATVFLYIGVRRFTHNMLFFAIAYYCSVLFLDVIQIRNYVAISLVIFAVSFLKKVTWWSVPVALIGCLAAAQFHTIGYVFLPVIVLRVLPKRWFKPVMIGLGVLVILAMMITVVVGANYVSAVLGKIAGLLTSRANLAARITSMYTDRTSLFRVVGLSFAAFSGVTFAYFLDRIGHFEGEARETFNTLLAGFMISFYALPADFLAYDYSRIQRNGFLFLIILAAYFFEIHPQLRFKLKIHAMTFFVMVTVTYFFFTCYLWRVTDMIPYLLLR
ncbi:EpsG family protein [Lacticaseibacillus sp. N501-2]|jgi:hypothetical protein|uniref:EpsG family protein n=1 Tax=Lacticaseibacillus salsurae TaxID=3367729 RepID=UPI0038B2B29B